MVAWKAVSKQATAGTSGRIWLTRWMPRSDIGWCRGARSTRASRPRTTSASTRTGSVNLPPPWTTRCPTASIGLLLATISRRAPWSTSPLGASTSSELTRLSSSSTDSLRVLEPAFTTRTRTWPGRSVGPGPAGDLGIVLSGDPGISARPRPFIFHLLAQGGRVGTQPGHPVDHVHDEMETVEVVQHHHVERSGGRALFLVTADVHVGVVVPPVGEAVYEPGVAVVGEDHGPVSRENVVELPVGKAVRVLAFGLDAHEVDDVNNPDLERRQFLAQDVHGGERLQRRDVPTAAHDYIRVAAVVGRPVPNPDPPGAMQDRLFHRQVIERRLLASDYHVHVMAATQAMVGYREQTVRVWRQVHPYNFGLFVDDVVYEPGVLVRKPVVILAPNV